MLLKPEPSLNKPGLTIDEGYYVVVWLDSNEKGIVMVELIHGRLSVRYFNTSVTDLVTSPYVVEQLRFVRKIVL